MMSKSEFSDNHIRKSWEFLLLFWDGDRPKLGIAIDSWHNGSCSSYEYAQSILIETNPILRRVRNVESVYVHLLFFV